jgi:multiple sugar transport system permease protein
MVNGGGVTGTRLGWAFVLPALAFLVLFNIYPLLSNIVAAFTNAELSGGTSEWVGGRNFNRVFSDGRYAAAVRTTALFTVIAVAIELLLGFMLALALHRRFPGKTVVLTLLLIPMMLPPAVMGIYWNFLFDGDYGVINQVLHLVGIAEPPQWRTDPSLKLWAVLAVDVWMWTPFMLLISLAGLGSIPTHLYEAAEIDRASPWLVFTRITLPLCAPLLVLAALLRTTDALKQFDLVMAITGPNDAATQTLSTLLYQTMFTNQRIGLGSAYACVVLVLVIALAIGVTRYLGRMRQEQAP